MSISEFITIVLSLFVPALSVGCAAVWLWVRLSGVQRWRAWLAGSLAALLAVVLGFGLLAFGPEWLPRWMGLHDAQIFGRNTFWSPTPFLAMAVVLPLALLLASFEGRRVEL